VIEISSQQLEREFNSFESIDMRNSNHRSELFNVFPEYLFQTGNYADIEHFNALTRYDNKNNTLVAQWCNVDHKIVTYKRRRLNGAKWVNRKDTHPNGSAFYRIVDADAPVYVVEGMRDALTAILLGLNFVAIPTTSFRNFRDINEIVRFADKIVFICEDKQGYKTMKEISKAVGYHTKNKKLICFTTSKDKKIDLSDFVMSCNSIEEVRNVIK
jgi:hypothetical protein